MAEAPINLERRRTWYEQRFLPTLGALRIPRALGSSGAEAWSTKPRSASCPRWARDES